MAWKDSNVFRYKKEKGLSNTHLTRTRWSEQAQSGETWKEYPRPGMKRAQWINLNGWWDYAIKADSIEPMTYDGRILVPFSPESSLSGVHRQLKPRDYLWYHREVKIHALPAGWHYLLHFGAVDQSCVIYIDGKEIFQHCGGYLPFSIDLCNIDSTKDTSFQLSLRVQDLSDTSYHSRGKQKLKRGGMFYTAQSGIWQTVWMEAVPDTYIERVKIDADYDTGKVKIRKMMRQLQSDHSFRNYSITESFVVDAFESWSPAHPKLYDLTVKEGLDSVDCYYAFRKLEIKKDKNGCPRFYLNGEICLQTGVLDQGYWCDGLYTAPSDEALIYDIQTMKDLGFNMLRKHIKIEPERWYYHCDRLGMLVWQDMVCGGTSYKSWFVTYFATLANIYHIPVPDGKLFRGLLSRKDKAGRLEYYHETEETIRTLYNHPCIVTWVPFNEAWGQFDAKKVADFVRKRDPHRWIDHASGWFDQKAGDIVSLHHYFFGLHYKAEENRVLAITEYGGYNLDVPGHSFSDQIYGYGSYHSKESLNEAYQKLYKEEVFGNVAKGVSAFIYTQLSDVEEENNGILTYDREVIKMDSDLMRTLNETFLS